MHFEGAVRTDNGRRDRGSDKTRAFPRSLSRPSLPARCRCRFRFRPAAAMAAQLIRNSSAVASRQSPPSFCSEVIMQDAQSNETHTDTVNEVAACIAAAELHRYSRLARTANKESITVLFLIRVSEKGQLVSIYIGDNTVNKRVARYDVETRSDAAAPIRRRAQEERSDRFGSIRFGSIRLSRVLTVTGM